MTVRNPLPKSRRPGFTLVEMLTVIVIIGILAGLIVGATVAARTGVKRAIIVAEIKQLEMKIDQYNSEVGEYPPDFSFCYHTDPAVRNQAQAEVLRHCRKRWPRATGITFASIEAACYGTPSPATALVFWLGGVQDSTGANKVVGFHTDPSNPFKAGKPRKTYYDFGDESGKSRLSTAGEFFPAGIQAPYVYFRARTINGRDEYGMVVGTELEISRLPVSSAGLAVPYLEGAVGGSDATIGLAQLLTSDQRVLYSTDTSLVRRVWRSDGKYQIVTAGFDNQFSTTDNDGTGPVPPQPWRLVPDLAQDPNWSQTGIWFSEADYDNVTNFAGGELEDDSP